MPHHDIDTMKLEPRVEEQQEDPRRRNAALTDVATVLTALVEQKESGPYSGKSLAWWKEALIDAQLSNLWFEEGDTEYLIGAVRLATGVRMPDEDYFWEVERLAEDIAWYEDE